VALSLWEIQEEHEIALVEAGISQRGEMQRLEKMIRPDIGVFTSLGTAHSDGFVSKEEKLVEKWKLFGRSDKVIAPSVVVSQELEDEKNFLWGDRAGDQVRLVDKVYNAFHTTVDFIYGDNSYQLDVPFVDKASVDNVLTCVATLLVLGYDMETIRARIVKLQPLEMRLKLKHGKDNCSIIDDSYSNDLASLRIALDFLKQQNQHSKKSLVITDFVGVVWNDPLKKKLTNLLGETSFDKIVLIGNVIKELATYLSGNIYVFDDTAAMIKALPEIEFQEETILIKGARKFELEKVINLLVQKSHDTVLEINLKSIEYNLSQYRAKLLPNVKLMAMVKAFSYGSGSFEVANVLQYNKVDYLTVAFVDEGVELRQGGITLPIMVLSPHDGTFEDMLHYELEPEIYSFRILRSFITFLEQENIRDYPIHIKLDTGMHRLGFMPEDISELLEILPNTGNIRVKSVFSHLAAAGNPEFDDFTDEQVRLYRELAAIMEQKLKYPFVKHICNSNAIVHRVEDQMDMVRLGIGLYGIDMAPKDLHLHEVGTLKTTITQIKELRKGETVGYDRKGVLYRDSKIATVKIGYADGYNRRLGNGVGQMVVNGQRVPTVGNICMDMCMLDITGLDIKEGDEVIVFPDVKKVAAEIGTIPYELLTGISSRVKRVYYYE
jgi:alanine racemase